jgi:hypothetical protein
MAEKTISESTGSVLHLYEDKLFPLRVHVHWSSDSYKFEILILSEEHPLENLFSVTLNIRIYQRQFSTTIL